METGILLELRGNQAVVLDSAGSFRQVKRKDGWQVGDTVPLAGAAIRPRRRLAMVLAACLVLLFCVGTAGAYFTPVAVVSVDGTPSVELTVNLLGRVVSATGRNQAGQALLTAVSVGHLPCDQAVAALLTAGEGEYAAVTVEGGDRLAQSVTTAVGNMASCHRVDNATVTAARGGGMTAGRYLALQALEEAAPQTDWDSYGGCSLGEIVEETARCHGQAQTPGEGAQGNGNGNGNGNGHHHGGRHQ